jgi:hypothetical protein
MWNRRATSLAGQRELELIACSGGLAVVVLQQPTESLLAENIFDTQRSNGRRRIADAWRVSL